VMVDHPLALIFARQIRHHAGRTKYNSPPGRKPGGLFVASATTFLIRDSI
jgi:hypothetical protein